MRSRVVAYGDLDLTVADGASTLYQRLKLAARGVCKMADGGYGDPAGWLRCYHDALVDAVRDLGNDRVTALYNGEHKARIPPATARATTRGESSKPSHVTAAGVSRGTRR